MASEEDNLETSTAATEANEFTFLYGDIGNQVEVRQEDQEKTHRGRKRIQDPEKWTKKFVKKPGLRKNSPLINK